MIKEKKLGYDCTRMEKRPHPPSSISISKSMRDSMSDNDDNIFGGACHSFREKEICDMGFDMGLCSMYQTII
jgi:hypothetical protein